jgi:dipeptidyl aminopeptidase/acylaminoacyl peptidase
MLALLIAGCNLPQPAPDPAVVATAVAATLAPSPAVVTPEPGESLLPHSLLYLSARSGSQQVWRLERDGVTQTQVTAEDATVDYFSVSPVDGTMAFVTSNQLYLIDADGSNRRLLVDNAAADAQADGFAYSQRISDPQFSPDGRYLAYAYNGLWILDISNNQAVHLVENVLDEEGGPARLYTPVKWAPNGVQLLLSQTGADYSSIAFVNPGADALLTEVDVRNLCCHVGWAPDSVSVLIASPFDGLIEAGLWRYNALSGEVSELIAAETDGLYEFAGWPIELENGSLQYFYASASELGLSDVPLYMVSSGPDGVSGRALVRAEPFSNIGEALWAADGSLALVVQRRPEGGAGGAVLVAFADDRQLQLLLDDGHALQWGN